LGLAELYVYQLPYPVPISFCILAHDAQLSLLRIDQGGEDGDESGLARSVRPEQAEDLARIDIQGDIL